MLVRSLVIVWVQLVLVAVAPTSPAQANWLTRILREAGDAGSGAGTRTSRLGLGALDDAGALVKALPDTGKEIALAAHATDVGHWRFVNRHGEVFTAATPDEMKRVASVLAPDAATTNVPLQLYLTEDSVFAGAAHVADLPATARLHVVAGKQSFPLVRRPQGGGQGLHARVGSSILVPLSDKVVFREALHHLGRPLERAKVRVIALNPGASDTVRRVPRLDAATGGPLVDEIDPRAIINGFNNISGQTALVTGRIDGEFLHFVPAKGGDHTVPLGEIRRAARQADVNLVIIDASSPRQPGGRNWLWRKVAVDGLDDALKRASTADFYDALAAGRGDFLVTPQLSDGRFSMRLSSSTRRSSEVTDQLKSWLDEAVSNVAGNVITNAVEIESRTRSDQQELDLRLIPGIPSLVQFGYLAGLVAGLFGWSMSRRWWARLWPLESRSEYAGAAGYVAAKAVRWLAFSLFFLPFTGPFAALGTLLQQVWSVLTAPVRLLRWMVTWRNAKPG